MTCHLIHRVSVLNRDRVEVRMSCLKKDHGTFRVFPYDIEELVIHIVDVKGSRHGDDRIQGRIIRKINDVLLAGLREEITPVGRSVGSVRGIDNHIHVAKRSQINDRFAARGLIELSDLTHKQSDSLTSQCKALRKKKFILLCCTRTWLFRRRSSCRHYCDTGRPSRMSSQSWMLWCR